MTDKIEKEIKEILSKWENCCKKRQCCNSCIQEKELGYGDDIEACCCRHNNNCSVLEEILKKLRGKA